LGTWQKKNGQGTLLYPNGSTYKGMWKAGKRHGRGIMDATKNGGYIYEGDWYDGVQCGEGSTTYANSATYKGQWKDGKFHGHGVFTYGTNDRSINISYNGEWHYGIRHGKGELVMANNNKFKGYFKDDKMHNGRLIFPNGTSYEGRWVNGTLLDGKLIFSPEKSQKIETQKKKKIKEKEEKTYAEFSEVLSGTMNAEGFLECGENKLYKIPQIYPISANLPILENSVTRTCWNTIV